ncbi:flagellar motor protein MotB [Vibrio agarivorans]|uniref:Flagellar motor protein MotB n=1 Tax=Vibrio agarivorans TaxID=153622 RepID=A0ABT7XVW7_9VIBR|nr:flagellar motor protein MotB [Vibrio agarivorans]MDN2479921.1 flagellar motor protein MotB [Vibrio agarivorans]
MRTPSEHIIVRKSRRREEGGNHGGAWKVAFADFTLAMMAFFMVMWVLQVSTDDEKERIVGKLAGSPDLIAVDESFNNNSLFPIDFGGSALPDQLSAQPTNPTDMGNSLTISVKDGDSNNYGGEGTESLSLIAGRYDTQEQMTILGQFIDEYSDHLNVSDHLHVEIVPQGLRVLVNDGEDKPMFLRGGSTLTHFFEDLLLSLAPVFATVENSLMISGHADSTGFNQRSAGNNWLLSGQRAQIAREILEFGGMPANRVSQVTAMSDTMLLDKQRPQSAINRRIEILVLTAQSEEMLNALFGHSGSTEHPSAIDDARTAALQNQMVDIY